MTLLEFETLLQQFEDTLTRSWKYQFNRPQREADTKKLHQQLLDAFETQRTIEIRKPNKTS